MIKLHGLEVSGNTYKAQLFMNLLGIDYEFLTLDVTKQQHKSEAFLKLNPRGEFPVLEDDSIIVWDSQAILIYLAQQYGSDLEDNHWYPENAAQMAHVTEWLTVANNEIFNSLAKARSMLKFAHQGDLDLYQRQGKQTLQWIEQHLSNRNWLATDKPSIADIACYPYVALCEEGHIPLKDYTAIHQWFDRMRELNGYISMPGLG